MDTLGLWLILIAFGIVCPVLLPFILAAGLFAVVYGTLMGLVDRLLCCWERRHDLEGQREHE